MMVKINEIITDEDKVLEEESHYNIEMTGKDEGESVYSNLTLTDTVITAAPDSEKSVKVSIDEHENCIAAGQINTLGVRLAELSLRLANLELKITKLENNDGFNGQSPAASLKSTMQQVRSISSQVEVITEGLRSTPGYNIGKTYNCNSCRSMGTIAIKVRCTTCDHENWWGWWPQRK
jgi:hypothetical protein